MKSKKGKKECCLQTAAGVSDASSRFQCNLMGEGSAVIAGWEDNAIAVARPAEELDAQGVLLADWLIRIWVQALTVPMHLGLKNGPFVPHNLILVQGSPAPLLKFQMARWLKLLMSSGSKRKESRYTCLSEAKAAHWQNVMYDIFVNCSLVANRWQ